MAGLNKIFEKKTASKPLTLAVFTLIIALLFFLLLVIKSMPPILSMKIILLFFLLNSVNLIFLDYTFTKLELTKRQFFFIPLTFVSNLYIFIFTNDFFFILIQLVFIGIFYMLLKNQNTENITMVIFHLTAVIIVIYFFNASSLSLIIPFILILIFFNINPTKNLLTLFVSSILVFFFIYSISFFASMYIPSLKIYDINHLIEGFRFNPTLKTESLVMTMCFLFGLYELPKLQRRAGLFKKSLFSFFIIFSSLDILADTFIEKYTFGMSIPVIIYLYSNFIYFRKKTLVREILFTGYLALSMVLIYNKL